MPVLGREHDETHAVGEDPAWSESWYFNAYDGAAGVGFVTRCGFHPNREEAHGFLLAWLPGGGFAWTETKERRALPTGAAIQIGPVRYDRRAPLAAWTIRASGADATGRRVEISAEVETIGPAVGVAGRRPEASAASNASLGALAAGHFEQPCRSRGTLVVDGRAALFDARGNRDKSWGPRRTDGAHGLQGWRWFSLELGDDLQLGGIRILTAEGAFDRGWVRRGDETASVKRWTIASETHPGGHVHRSLALEAHLAQGEPLRIEGEVLRVAPISIGEAAGMEVLEGLTRFRSGDRVGHGIAEYAHLLDGAGAPVVPVD